MIFTFTECRMRLLAIETSTPAASVAVIEWNGEGNGAWAGESDGPVSAGRVRVKPLKPGRPQTETLLETIDQLLVECGHSVRELDGFAAAIGPGAYIGVRVGIATVKGLAMGAGKPVVPVSTLEGLAFRALEPESSAEVSHESMTRLTICPMIDARRGEVYAACYRPDLDGMNLIRQEEATLTMPADLLERLGGPVFFLGDGARLHRSAIIDRLGPRALFPPAARPDLMEPSAAAVARLAVRGWREGHGVDPDRLVAIYLRPAVEPVERAMAE
jgi:tRNA threonylcarbamoyladenosine biosynthesis protein TsaB